MGQQRLQPGQKLVIASHNRGKIPEFARLLQPLGLELSCAADYGIPEPEETGTTFIENALIKARAVTAAAGLPSLADDSGLAVTALNGDPGVYSARWAGPERDFDLAMRKVETLLTGQSDRSAQFVTVLALCWPDGMTATYDGAVQGALVWPPRGAHGFGYDPVFVPDGYTQSFGEMSPEQKNKLSHRARACAALIAEQSEAVLLYRPTGPQEIDLVKNSGFKRWPPRLPEQPIFYPVTNEHYAIAIARDWNVPASGYGCVTRFAVKKSFMKNYDTKQVGGSEHTEWWIPAEKLEEMNDNIVGQIEVIHEFK